MPSLLAPLGDHLVIIPSQDRVTQHGSIIIPENAQDLPVYGIVEAMGPDVDPSQINIGDKVIYGKYSGALIEYKSREYLIIRADELMAVLNAEES